MNQNRQHTLKTFSQDNTLIIPEVLHEMKEAHVLMQNRSSSIFYKEIHEDLTGIEFLVNTPCLIFISSGKETFISSDDEYFVTSENEMLGLPQNIYMISDFFKADGVLKTYLFFFDNSLIDEFLASRKIKRSNLPTDAAPCKLISDKSVVEYINALNPVYREVNLSADILRLKLLELLYLIDNANPEGTVTVLLSALNSSNQQRNIRHIMKQHCLTPMNITDYAQMSGRSLASFNRDFRRLYNTSPKQWLIETRLERAQKMIADTSMTVTQIAYAVGYENTSHFISLYKEKYGKTPSQDRKQV